jgi:CHAD domain-containing protein
MGNLIAAADREKIDALSARATTATMRRRAEVLLLYDQGLPTQEVAERVELSPSRTRYWRRRYLFEGMQIFSGSELGPSATGDEPREEEASGRESPEQTPAVQSDEGSDIQLLPESVPDEEIPEQDQDQVAEPQSEQSPVSLAELRQRYPANLRQAEHRRDLALELFDASQSIHHLPQDMRRILEVSALLQHLTENQEEEHSNKSGYLFILSHPLTDLTADENKLVETILASLHGKAGYPPSPVERDQILSPAEHEAFTLAAILHIAHGLDNSGTQATVINSVELLPKQIDIRVNGPRAKKDARKAAQSSKLWTRLYGQKIKVQAIYQFDQEPDERLKELLARTKPGIQPDDDLAEAGRKVMGYHFAQMLLHEAGTRQGEDIEELHDMRVATRRMRAAFEVFGEAFDRKSIKIHLKGLRAAGRALGRVRDLDVFMEKAQQYLDSIPQEQRSGLDPLLSIWENERLEDRSEMLVYLDSQDYANFKRKFLKFVTTPGAGARKTSVDQPDQVKLITPILVYTRLAAVRAYGPLLDSATIDQLHALRIEFKKLRYTLEFFSEVLGKETKLLIADIKKLQDHLGDLNDADVACTILRDFLDNWESRQVHLPIIERENPEPVVAYLANKHAERYFLTTTFKDAWSEFDQPEVRTRIASAVAIL